MRQGYGTCDKCYRIVWLVSITASAKGMAYGCCGKCCK